MAQYKIYKDDNYIVVVNSSNQETHYGLAKDVFIEKSNTNIASYKLHNINDFDENLSLPIAQILKEDGTSYSVSDFETFYKANTGDSSSGGSGGGGDASAANQVIANDKLTSIDNTLDIPLSILDNSTVLSQIKTKTDNLDVLLSTRATSANQVTANNSIASIDLKTAPSSTLSPTNSSAVALGANAVFTGTSFEVLGYTSITVSVFSNQASATDGLQVQQSSDNTNWDFIDAYSIPAATGKTFSIPVQARYARVIYTNGATLQTTFRLQTIIHTYKPRAATIRPQDARTNDNDFDEVASYGMLFNGTSWDRSRGTITNGMLVDVSRIIPGVTATSLGKAEDAVAATGDTGVFMLGVRRDTLLTSSSATGDYNEMAVDRYGSAIIKDQTRHKRTYSLAFTVAPTTAATDIFQMIGSATTTVSVTKINISGTQTTGGQTNVIVSKRSTANTGGTSSPSTMIPHDSTDAAATSVGAIYTANPTTGTPVGDLRRFSLPLGAVTATTNNIVQLDFGERGKPIVLNGVAQALVISLGGVTLAGGSINVWVEFTEE